MNVGLLESAVLLNLLVLSTANLYKWESFMVKMILLEVSLRVTFVQFCVIIAWSLVKHGLSAVWRCRQNHSYDVIDENINDD